MRLFSKPRPLLGSFVAAAVALLPLLIMAVLEINSLPSDVVALDQIDDSGIRGAGLALAAAPFLYVVGVPVCFAFGRLLIVLGLRRLIGFMGGTAVIAILLGLAVGGIISSPARYGLSDAVLSVVVSIAIVAMVALPASLVWWLFAVHPHNLQFDIDASGAGQSGR